MKRVDVFEAPELGRLEQALYSERREYDACDEHERQADAQGEDPTRPGSPEEEVTNRLANVCGVELDLVHAQLDGLYHGEWRVWTWVTVTGVSLRCGEITSETERFSPVIYTSLFTPEHLQKCSTAGKVCLLFLQATRSKDLGTSHSEEALS